MSLPGTRLVEAKLPSLLMTLPVRSAVFELSDARVLWSPASSLTPAQLRELGEITDIVAPSLLHTGGVPGAAAAHPSARLWGPRGAREKQPALGWHGVFGVDAWPYDDELAVVPLDGAPKVREHLFLHRASRALYLVDAVFHVNDPEGPLTGLFLRMFGTYRRFAVSKLFLSMVRDRAAFEASVARVAALDFDHVVMAHGEAVLGDGKARLLEAFRERRLLGG